MNCCRLSPYCIYSFKLNPTCVFGAVTQHFSIICAKFFNSKKKELILYYTNFEEARVSCVYYFSLLVYSGLQKIEKRRERKERRISWFHEKRFILTYLKIILILLQPSFFGYLIRKKNMKLELTILDLWQQVKLCHIQMANHILYHANVKVSNKEK